MFSLDAVYKWLWLALAILFGLYFLQVQRTEVTALGWNQERGRIAVAKTDLLTGSVVICFANVPQAGKGALTAPCNEELKVKQSAPRPSANDNPAANGGSEPTTPADPSNAPVVDPAVKN